jgi:hypothetical protein
LPSLAAIELWNEPNGNFLYASDRAAAYAGLVRAAYPAVKAVAPGLPVLMSMAGTGTSFLAALYGDGVRGYYDGIAVHPYDQPTLAGLTAFRSYQVSGGDITPLWVTEVGWSSASVGTYLQGLGVTVMLSKLAALPYVAATEIYEMRDGGTGSDPENHFGLVDTSLNPKPAWGAFVNGLSGLPAATKAAAGSRLVTVWRP